MSLLGWFLGLLSGKRPTPPAAQRAAATSTTAPAEPPLFVGWQEMIDRQGRIGGYLLKPQSPAGQPAPSGRRLLAALERERLDRLGAARPLIVPVSAAQWRDADFRQLASPAVHFLLTTQSPPDITVAALHSAGHRVALPAAAFPDEAAAPAMLVVDFQHAALADLETRIRALRERHPALRLVADGVASWSEHRLCLAMGFSFSIGPFTTTPDDAETGDPLSGSRLVALEMLKQLRADAPAAAIAETAKRDPAIVVKLLRMSSSPLYGVGRPVTRLDEAIALLGRDAMYRWLAVALFKLGSESGRDQTLLVVALARAVFLESLAPPGDAAKRDELFLLGLLSVLDSLLAQPMARIVGQMALPPEVAAALLGNDGPLARYLLLAVAMERCRLDQAAIAASVIGIDSGRLIACYSRAMELATAELADAGTPG
jgi:EAL and modified HD-GYP domain-containing signal transduction protein